LVYCHLNFAPGSKNSLGLLFKELKLLYRHGSNQRTVFVLKDASAMPGATAFVLY
jgi:hypothetical protein